MADRFSASSKASIDAAIVHWNRIRDEWSWPLFIETGDRQRGAKLVTFVLGLMAHEREPDVFYPSSTITNYVWALCAFMQQNLFADPRAQVTGWRFFMAAVTVMCYVPYEPRARVPTAAIRASLTKVDKTSFREVQTALLVLLLWFTLQRSEFPCPHTYGGMDPAKHLYVCHMEPHHGGTRWAIGATKADPRAERLSADAGPGREWIEIGEVNDDLFDMRIWLQLFYSFLPEGPRDPNSPFFLNTTDKTRPLLYRNALADFRQFVTGQVDDPKKVGLHGIRSEGFVVCSNAVGEEAAVILGGWRGIVTARRYDRLTQAVQTSMASDMVAFTSPSTGRAATSSSQGESSSAGGLGIAARRAAARPSVPRPRAGHASAPADSAGASSSSRRLPAALPAGWRRVWHATSNKQGGYATFVGPNGRHARTIGAAVQMAASHVATVVVPPPRARVEPVSSISVDNLVDHVTEFDRPPTRRPPAARGRLSL